MDVGKRLRRLSEILARELEVIQLGSKIQSQVQSEIEKGQREYYLREQLKAIQQELGEADEQQAEINELRERIEAAELPEHARKQADRELGRLERLPPAAAEYGVIRTYLEWLVELPWSGTPRTTSTSATRARSWTPITTTWRRSRTGSSSTWRCGSSPRIRGAPPAGSDPLLRRAARGRQDQPRPVDRARRSGASSSGSRSAGSATRPRSAATGGPTSARCRGRSCARFATRARATRCS